MARWAEYRVYLRGGAEYTVVYRRGQRRVFRGDNHSERAAEAAEAYARRAEAQAKGQKP
jgi:hypothetical protein